MVFFQTAQQRKESAKAWRNSGYAGGGSTPG